MPRRHIDESGISGRIRVTRLVSKVSARQHTTRGSSSSVAVPLACRALRHGEWLACYCRWHDGDGDARHLTAFDAESEVRPMVVVSPSRRKPMEAGWPKASVSCLIERLLQGRAARNGIGFGGRQGTRRGVNQAGRAKA